ncbi:MAG: type II secretion system F family protein [Kiritimatiellae bacterium]|nr:type II secretion system F family protein [Kiritimatiellia bacterium]
MTGILGWAGAILWMASAALFTWYAIGVAQQITYVTLADGRKQERRIPLIFRLLLPLTPNVKGLMLSPRFEKLRKKTDGMIVTAGFEGLVEGWELLALKLVLPLCLGPLWCLILYQVCGVSEFLSRLFPALTLLGVVFFYIYPVMWLRSAVKLRQHQILRAMPFVLDLLTLSVEAGLDFMSAVQRATEREKLDALSEELLRMVREIQVGTTRKNALKAMSDRVDLPDMRALVNALVQADELGVAVGSILRIQSDQIRVRRFERAEKLANEAPTKLLGPLMVFIFPAVFIILLGPLFYKLAAQV